MVDKHNQPPSASDLERAKIAFAAAITERIYDFHDYLNLPEVRALSRQADTLYQDELRLQEWGLVPEADPDIYELLKQVDPELMMRERIVRGTLEALVGSFVRLTTYDSTVNKEVTETRIGLVEAAEVWRSDVGNHWHTGLLLNDGTEATSVCLDRNVAIEVLEIPEEAHF